MHHTLFRSTCQLNTQSTHFRVFTMIHTSNPRWKIFDWLRKFRIRPVHTRNIAHNKMTVASYRTIFFYKTWNVTGPHGFQESVICLRKYFSFSLPFVILLHLAPKIFVQINKGKSCQLFRRDPFFSDGSFRSACQFQLCWTTKVNYRVSWQTIVFVISL